MYFLNGDKANLNDGMKIQLNDYLKLQSVQEEFHKIFPYLMLEFFNPKSRTGETNTRISTKQSEKTLGECRNGKSKSRRKVSITADMTVADLEQTFVDIFGLNAKVLRKSGKSWLKTTVTDYWTLEEQNKQGEALSRKSGKVN